jgi:hypothetical protein
MLLLLIVCPNTVVFMFIETIIVILSKFNYLVNFIFLNLKVKRKNKAILFYLHFILYLLKIDVAELLSILN